MKAIDKFKKLFDKLTTQRGDQWLEKNPVWTGDFTGQVRTDTVGMIYVRELDTGQVLTVFNNVAPAEYNIPVLIGRSKDQPQLWQVISRREVWDVPASSSVVHHHQQHMLLAPDMVPIDRKQILALTVFVSDPANFVVRVYGSVVHTATGIVKISTQDIDLSSYVVTAGAKFVSIETDDDGALTVHEGTAFDAPEIGTYADIPVPDAGKYLIGFVLLYDGQSVLSDNDIRVPFPLGVIAKSSGLQIYEAAADTPLDADKFGFWDVVDNVLKSITWANIQATLKTYFDTLYSVLGHSHAAPDASVVTYTPTDNTDWTGSADPGDVDNALDQLAQRVTDGGGGLPNPFALPADISPAALTADVDDYNPTGAGTADVWRLSTDGNNWAINGIAGGADGRIIILASVAGGLITLKEEALTSAAANRFGLGADKVLFPYRSIAFRYDATLSRWRELFTGDASTVQGALFSAALADTSVEGNILMFTSSGYWESTTPVDIVDYLTEPIQDLVGAMFSGNTETGIAADYQDADGTIDLVVSASGGLANSNISPTTADVSATVNTRYFANVSGLTANRNFIVPAGTVGDIIELNIKTGDDTYALIVIGDTGITINGGSAATEWSRLFITGETVQLIADTTSNWQVVIDKRIPCFAEMDRITTSITTNSAGTKTTVDWNNTPRDRGNIADLTNNRFNIRRANQYEVSFQYRPANAVTDQKYISIILFGGASGATEFGYALNRAPATGAATLCVISNRPVTCSVADQIIAQFATEEANIGMLRNDAGDQATGGSWMSIKEVL